MNDELKHITIDLNGCDESIIDDIKPLETFKTIADGADFQQVTYTFKTQDGIIHNGVFEGLAKIESKLVEDIKFGRVEEYIMNNIEVTYKREKYTKEKVSINSIQQYNKNTVCFRIKHEHVKYLYAHCGLADDNEVELVLETTRNVFHNFIIKYKGKFKVEDVSMIPLKYETMFILKDNIYCDGRDLKFTLIEEDK